MWVYWFIQNQSELIVAHNQNEPSQEVMVLFVLRKLILQTRMRRHPVGLGV